MPDDPGVSRELDLRDYSRVLRRRRGTIALTVVLAVGAALVFSLLQTATYEATTQVLVELPGGAIEGTATELVLMQAPAVRTAVADRLGHPPDVSVQPVEDTNVFAITAASTSARGAARDANVYARVYVELHREQTSAAAEDVRRKIAELDAELAELETAVASASPGDQSSVEAQQASERGRIAAERSDNVAELDALLPTTTAQGASLVARASVPTSPAKPATRRNVLIALLVGLVLGVMAALVRDHFDDVVQGRGDVEQVTGGLLVVGMIPSARGWRGSKWA